MKIIIQKLVDLLHSVQTLKSRFLRRIKIRLKSFSKEAYSDADIVCGGDLYTPEQIASHGAKD